MPVANAFLSKEQLEKEEFLYPMEVGFCENCKMVQLVNIVPYEKYIVPDISGKRNYAFFSSTSKSMEEHFAELAKDIETKFLEKDSKVLEIGSNDGIMLKAFKNHKVLGVEPSNNVAEVAVSIGVETITEFFTKALAEKILAEKGKFRTIASTNVILNIIDLHECMESINLLLDEKGVFITEDPYVLSILEQTAYDQIYDEHIWYFSLTSMNNLLNMHGMEVFDAEKQWVHGGSMRVYACKIGKYEKTERLKDYLLEETKRGIDKIEPYLKFSRNTEESKETLSKLLRKLKSEGKKIVGYGASSKGTIVCNYCGIGTDILDYISDSTPYKQGLYNPGKHIPVVSPDVFHMDHADYAILFIPNHIKEVMGKEQEFIGRGGKFIVHWPNVKVMPETVEVKNLKVFANDQGYLFETLRDDDKIFNGKFGQVLVSVLYPGVIKGMHKHEKQTDYTSCIKGNVKYVAIKENKDGTLEVKTFVIGERNPLLIKTPPGIWHGYTPLSNQEAVILHVMDKAYDVNDDDTERKDPYFFGDVWSVKNN